MPAKPDSLLTTAEAAKALGVHPSTVSQWRHFGLGPKFVRKGRRVHYRSSDLADYKRSNPSMALPDRIQPVRRVVMRLPRKS